MAKSALPDGLAALESDEGIAELVRSLSLAEGFYFYLLICETPRVAKAAFDVVGRRLAEDEGRSVPILRIDPYEKLASAVEPMRYELLVDEVLARLIAPEQRPVSEEAIVVVDGARALPRDDEAWGVFFQRLNERRNVIVQALGRPLVLCVPGRLEVLFAKVAPDFWSIRSLAVAVNVHASAEMAMRGLESLSPEGDEIQAERRPGALEEARMRVAEARAGVAQNPNDDSAVELLVRRLGDLTTEELRRGTLDAAALAASEAEGLDRRRWQEAPESPSRMKHVSVTLSRVGDVHGARGELDRARTLYEESLQLSRRLVASDPERLEWLRDLATDLSNVGNVHQRQGKLDRALADYEECLHLCRHLVATAPQRVEWLRTLSAALGRVGDVYVTLTEFDRALEAYEESVQLARRLVASAPERSAWLLGLSISLIKVGDVYQARGELDRAGAAYEESLQLCRQVAASDPEDPEWLHNVAISLASVYDVHLARGEVELARVANAESLQLFRALLKRDPARPSFHAGTGASLARDATLAEASGRKDEALARWHDALAEFTAITRGTSHAPEWIDNADVCRAAIARLEAALPVRVADTNKP